MRKRYLFTTAAALFPALHLAIYLARLPERVATHFDGAGRANGLFTPVLDTWKQRPADVHPYFKGTWGPAKANDLLGEGRVWREP